MPSLSQRRAFITRRFFLHKTLSLFLWKRQKTVCARLAWLVAAFLVFSQSALPALIDTWRASDLDALDDGDSVGAWNSISNRLATAPIGDEPRLKKGATPTGETVVHFAANRMTIPASPVGGKSAFTLVVVFKVDALGVDEGSGWSTKSGIVDANQSGMANDWGFSVRETGYISFGTGSYDGSDRTVYLDNQPTYPSVVDGKYHVVVCAWGGGTQTMYLDDLPSKMQTGVSTLTRGNPGMSFGGINTGELSRRFTGDIAEIRFYDTVFDSEHAASIIEQLSGVYVRNVKPQIADFSAGTNFVYQGTPLTLFWAVSNAASVTIDNGIGDVPLFGSAEVTPTATTTYTLTASNGFSRATASTTVTVDPGIPVAEVQDVSVTGNTARSITLTGHDPQSSVLSFSIVKAPSHGALAGTPPNVSYTPSRDYTGPDFFTFKVNDGSYDSLPATVQLYVDAAALPPHEIFLNTTTIDATVKPGAFLAALRAVDSNRFDVHTFALVPGVGSTNNGMFSVSGNQLLAGPGFPTVDGTNLFIRVRATDLTGLSAEKAFVLKAERPERHIVINEIHYNPPENPIREEFIELFNPDAVPVDLSLWRIRGGVDYVFTNGTTIPAGGYLVVASDPATIAARFGVAAVGPWDGNLSSDGEHITLRDPSDEIVDEVDYKSEFPWPIAANGDGPSMELINPALDNDLGSSWASPLHPAIPSPGSPNQAFVENAAPNIRHVNHSPQQPDSTEQVTITAKVTDRQGVASVNLSYQVVAPGNYISAYIPLTVAELNADPSAQPQPNPAFEAATNWTTVVMHDDGLNGDEEAGDDIYSVVLPVQPNRTLVRYRITCADTFGTSRRAPFEDDPSLNFAYFVYEGVPDYGGIAASSLTNVPVYFLITRTEDFDACAAYKGSDQIPQYSGNIANEARFVFNWPGAFVYDGEVYDHIRYRLRGANGRYQPGRRSFRFRFNDGRYFAAKDEFGRPYARKWSSLNTAKGQSNRQTVTFSLNECVSYFLLNEVGVPSPYSHYFNWRVIRGPLESPSLFDGDFYGLFWTQEEYDAAFLEAHSLAKGNLYKLINAPRATNPYDDMVGQRRYQGAFAVTNGADAVRIQNALLNPNSSQSDDWLLANVNYTNWYAYDTILEAVRNYDTWPSANKNAAWYFDTDYTAANEYNGRFWTLPWDWTDSWGPTWNAGQDLAWNGVFGYTKSLHADMLRDYRNTVRGIRDLLFQPGQINPVIDAFAARIAAIAPADVLRWSNSTPYGAAYTSLEYSGPGFTDGVNGYVQDMKDFMFNGGSHAWWIDRQYISDSGWIQRLDDLAEDSKIPNEPTVYYVGQPGFPMNSLTFECLPFSDPQGADTFAAMEWRLAEVTNTNEPPADPRVIPPLEWDALWTSGELHAWSNRITIPGIYVETNKVYRVRVRHEDDSGRWSHWSAPVQFSVSAVDVTALLREGLRFSEIMYHPPAFDAFSGDDLEFLELKNISGCALDLSGLVFSGITFTFPDGTILQPGQTFLLGRNVAALQAKYPGITVDGIYSGKLDNGGETIRLNTPSGERVIEVTYKDSPPWPVTADGFGWSLVLANPVASTYRVSSREGGSPGEDDAPSTIPPIVINELLTHTDLPEVDSIELFNPTSAAADIGGWFLTDNASVPMKFRIPDGIVIPPESYVVLDESNFNIGPAAFALSSLGDDVYLFSGDAATNLTGYVHGATFGASKNGVSFGRYVNSIGQEEFVPLSALTLGANNARPLVGPIVISEIMYQPPEVGGKQDYDSEFIELQNAVATNVPLYSVDFPTNTWRLGNAVDYFFPTNTVLPTGGRLLVVGFDPAANPAALQQFRSKYSVSTNVPIFGPWSGHLENDGESVELKFPDTPEADGSVPYILSEKVAYRPVAPWPAAAAGGGGSLQRDALLAYANDPANWFAAVPTAGTLSSQTSQDLDSDGMPDVWELSNGTNPFVPDSDEDPDGDGMKSISEYLAGTDPNNPESALKLEAHIFGANFLNLRFTAQAGHSYTVLASPVLNETEWTRISDIPSAPTNRAISLDQPTADELFYRLVTPSIP